MRNIFSAQKNALLYYISNEYPVNKYCFSQQKELFDSIKPLFNNKPLLVVSNKCDVLARSEFTEEKEAIFKELEKELGRDILEMSTVTENGIMDVKVLNFILYFDFFLLRSFKFIST